SAFLHLFIFSCFLTLLHLHSFPTRRSSDLAFLSKALGEKNKHLSIYEKEFLALILAVDKWRPYLQRAPFIIRTDHQSLTFLGERSEEHTSELQSRFDLVCRLLLEKKKHDEK